MASITPLQPRCRINHAAYHAAWTHPLPHGFCILEFLSDDAPEESSGSAIPLLPSGTENCCNCPVWDDPPLRNDC